MKHKKLVTFLAAAVVMAVPCKITSAASVSFSNYSYTSTPNCETWSKIVSKTKADNEQTWYATLTASSGLSSTVDRAMFVSGRASANSIQPDSAPVPLYKSTTSVKCGYITYLKKGTKCWLYITGDENNKNSYKVSVSGRYTS